MESIWVDPALEQSIQESTLDYYSERKRLAILEMMDFAFETNYHTADVLKTLDIFRVAGYNTTLNFILLENVELAIERVRLRVAKGGHNVDEATIRSRFQHGLELLNSSFNQYDSVNIYFSSYNKISGVASIQPKKGVAYYEGEGIPRNLLVYLPDLSQFLDEKGNG